MGPRSDGTELPGADALHEGGEHHAVVYDHFADPGSGALWTRWQDGTEPDTV
ncbi:hypothetical protein [Actinacidiphila epipremni]|uniref:Uncharacterized protein n=1 Tax=Actinacidiphila epipremni TaxID=2053013 RepID=A0ABX0ZWZ5_9ACTN|nr:hypothetical protein [Actinacidiphila epipremni]NJP46093.1 hypothetical protein [Actinacidiphila epipremni]